MIFICSVTVLVNANGVSAATTGQVLIVFDDGNVAQYDTAFQYMQTKGILGTAYVNGATIGQSGASTMTLAELQQMDAAGWAIANHGYQHQSFNGLSDSDIASQIQQNINFLTSNGLSGRGAYDLSYPGGFYGSTQADVDRIWAIMENLGIQTGRTINGDPTALSSMYMYQVPGYVVQNTDPVATIEAMIDQAKTGSTVVLLFHNIVPTAANQNPNDYDYVSSDFQSIIDYISTNLITTETIDQLYTQKQNSLIQSAVAVTGASGYKDATVNLVAKLTANGNVPGIDLINQQTIHFYIDNVFVGNAVTDSTGTATLSHVITDSIGSHNVVAKFVIGTYISASQGATTLQVNLMPTNLVVKSAAGLEDSLVDLVATLTDTNGQAVAYKSVLFSIDGNNAVNALTDANGVATLSHKVTESLGPHTILATFAKDDKYDASSGSNTLTAGIIPTSMVVSAVNGATNSVVNLIATLTDNNNKPVQGKTLQFFVDDILQGSNTTDATGTATWSHTVSENQGSHIIKATFTKDEKYDTSTNTNTLTVPDTTPPTAWDSVKGGLYKNNQIVTLAMSEPGTIYCIVNGGPMYAYSNPITISQTSNLNYYAMDQANNPSPVYSEHYTIDKIAPKVSTTTPAYKKTKVSKTSSILIRFSETVSASTKWSGIYVKNVNKNKKISISKSLSKNTLTIKTSKRSSKTTYQVYLPGGSVKDTAGNNLAVHYSTTFKTA